MIRRLEAVKAEKGESMTVTQFVAFNVRTIVVA